MFRRPVNDIETKKSYNKLLNISNFDTLYAAQQYKSKAAEVSK